jgi:HSP20 family protein
MEGTTMAIVRWDPLRDLMSIQERVGRLLADAPARWGADEGYGAWAPPVDIFEKGDALVIRAEMPGVDRSDIDVRIENGVLMLKGERKHEEEIHDKNAYRMERVYGSFARSFSLPTTVDASKISARLKDGVLELVLPKAEEAKPKKVTIQSE